MNDGDLHSEWMLLEKTFATRWDRPGCQVFGWSGYIGLCREVRTGTSGCCSV